MNQSTTLLHDQEFKGDKKELVHCLAPYEKKFINAVLPLIPAQITTAHLTLMTLLWSSGIAFAGFKAQGDIRWLWLFSACVLFQYISDMLDGAVGRIRHTGLIKWGFYMDHFLDFVFLSSIIIGYSFLLPSSYALLSMLCLACATGFMVHTMMDFAITNDFKISLSYFGVSEARFVIIILNTLFIIFGKIFLVQIFPYFVAGLFITLCLLVHRSQKLYSHLDAKKQSQENP